MFGVLGGVPEFFHEVGAGVFVFFDDEADCGRVDMEFPASLRKRLALFNHQLYKLSTFLLNKQNTLTDIWVYLFRCRV